MDINRSCQSFALELLDFAPVLGIIGSRQVGKTTLSRQLSRELNKPVHYLDMEDPNDRERLSDPMLYFKQYEEHCVILDEIQRKPELFEILRPIIDAKRESARFIILGSASPAIIRGTSESLAGRVSYVELDPLNVTEIDDPIKLWWRGGYPSSYLAKSDRQSFQWRKNYIRSYVERDLPLLGLNISPTILQSLWEMLAYLAGNLLNAANLSKSLGVSQPSIMKYLHFMEEAFLLRRLPSFHHNIKKRLVKAPKIYVRDSGLLHALLKIQQPDGIHSHPNKGNIWENFVVEQITSSLGDRYSYYFYRTHQGAECDLVLTDGLTAKISIEIKYSSSPKISKGFVQSIEDLGTQENYVLYIGTEEFEIKKGITALNLSQFIEKLLIRE